jgi:hypothetical protein
MTTLPVATLIESITTLLTEAYAGPPDSHTTWFVDNADNAGLLGLLADVTAAEASTSADGSGRPGTTVAAHLNHLRWTLANLNATLRGAAWNPNWSESWELNTADQAAWQALRDTVRAEFDVLREALGQQTELPGEYLTGTLALLPHAAYHLGTIRQMIERVRNDRRPTTDDRPAGRS